MIFPDLKTRFMHVNLNERAVRWRTADVLFADVEDARRAREAYEGNNPLLQPHRCEEFVRELHKEIQGTSYGGYLEDRSFLWRGSYLQNGPGFLHLGVDFNVGEGVRVASSLPGHVIHIDCDSPEEHGWGTRVVFAPDGEDVVLLYAHLAHNRQLVIGDKLEAGDIIGATGPSENNGGWFPHLHVQAIQKEYWRRLIQERRLTQLDGYGAVTEGQSLARVFPDPLRWIRFDRRPTNVTQKDLEFFRDKIIAPGAKLSGIPYWNDEKSSWEAEVRVSRCEQHEDCQTDLWLALHCWRQRVKERPHLAESTSLTLYRLQLDIKPKALK